MKEVKKNNSKISSFKQSDWQAMTLQAMVEICHYHIPNAA